MKLRTTMLTFALLAAVAACGDDDHGTVHVMVTAAPPTTATVGTAFDVSWMVHNDSSDDLHHTEIRVCEGASVMDCGMGAMGTYTSVTGSMTSGTFTASVTLSTAGDYTIVAWCHVGEDPHASSPYNVTAQ